MKKITFLIMASLLLTACSDEGSEEIESSFQNRFDNLSGRAKMVTDEYTNCKYIQVNFGQGTALTPLLKSDGNPDCDK